MIVLQALVIFVCVLGAALALSRYIVWLEKQTLQVDGWKDMSGWEYLRALVILSAGVGAWVWVACMLQGGVTLEQALQTAVAVMTHTNWQPWAPEETLSAVTLGLGVLPGNLLIGAVCIAAWRALVHALARKPLGNAWAGVWRGLLILLPLQMILTAILISQGVPQVQMALFSAGNLVSGAGAGWLGDNLASKIQNPTLISDVSALTLLIALPLAFCYATGQLIARAKLMERLTLALVGLLVIFSVITLTTTPQPSNWQHWAMSEALWVNATAGSANGTLNTPLEHLAPAGRLPPFLTLLAGLPVPPAIGIGVGIMLMYLFVAIYLACLMVGRSPTFLGFKVGLGEVVSVAAGVLGPQLVVLAAAAVTMMTPQAHELIANQGAPAMSALLWMLGSTAQNNGSTFNLALTQPTFIQTGTALMLAGRLLTLGAVVIFAGQLARQRTQPAMLPLLEEKSTVMIVFWLCVMITAAALAMLPFVILGPLLEVLK